MNQIDLNGGLKGHWKLEAYVGEIRRDALGNILNERAVIPEWGASVWEGDNLIVNNGKNQLLNRLFNTAGAPAAVSAMGVGTDSTAAAVGQTQLNPSVAGSVLLQAFDSTPSPASSQVITCATTYGTGVANFAWAELGLFNGTVNGTSTMLNRIAPIGPFAKTSAVSIAVTVTITQA